MKTNTLRAMMGNNWDANGPKPLGGQRMALIFLMISLHIALLYGALRTRSQPASGSVRYMTVFNVPQKKLLTVILPTPREMPQYAIRPPAIRPKFVVPRSITIDTAIIAPVVSTVITPKPDPHLMPSPRQPRINIDSLLAAARANDQARVRTPLELVRENESRPVTLETTVADAAQRSARRDCQTAYAGSSLRLLALIPLAIGTLTDTGCKWK
jgi:hypothetical protein